MYNAFKVAVFLIINIIPFASSCFDLHKLMPCIFHNTS